MDQDQAPAIFCGAHGGDRSPVTDPLGRIRVRTGHWKANPLETSSVMNAQVVLAELYKRLDVAVELTPYGRL